MSNRRAEIAMSPDEVLAFLDEERVVTVATLGRDGFPHLMPLWFVVRDGELWGWTYGKSQKVVNLERDARCTLQVEAGDSYDQLRGVMVKARAAVHRDSTLVAEIGNALSARYGDGSEVDARVAAKRVALQFEVLSISSFDHRKLYGSG
ncbi:pyridoxamine 5'-phosphate oxidase family protein [Solirubrobacter phytolaccae]|uniref:Pyridoxamine 5'-phosphate oxidase family protein n=1 Tax=Solirubrobacter phytolaccae TaxID=1404360 RepID=A0A9X3N3E3_9ACTN|nr:pyridoxamine 5'-phosphate oxidase family protein [Solirubrobacter phytolaccae]MDA0179080.1 pyridoxamine 5'-phosphate oxidase family protein [Solirubrobacter phytolaccae]